MFHGEGKGASSATSSSFLMYVNVIILGISLDLSCKMLRDFDTRIVSGMTQLIIYDLRDVPLSTSYTGPTNHLKKRPGDDGTYTPYDQTFPGRVIPRCLHVLKSIYKENIK